MNAGVELDKLVAEKVMGLKVVEDNEYPGEYLYLNEERDPRWIPEYSIDIADTWRVIEKLDRAGWHVTLTWVGSWTSGINAWRCLFFSYENWGEATASTAPLAICLAALKACGVEVTE